MVCSILKFDNGPSFPKKNIDIVGPWYSFGPKHHLNELIVSFQKIILTLY